MQTGSGYVDIEDGQLYYEIAGNGEPLVLSHALFLDSRMFDSLWPKLTQNYQVLRYDLRGFGKSSEAHGPANRRADLKRLLDHLSVPCAHWVGCSNSGQLMLDLALEAPARVKSLTLVDSSPSGYAMPGEIPPNMAEMFAAVQNGNIDEASELQIRIWLDGQFRTPQQVDPQLRAKALEMNRISVEHRTFLIADWQPSDPLQPPALERLHTVPCPTLIVVGALDHPAVIEAAEMMTKNIPNAQKRIINDSGHVPSYEQPDQFIQILLTFMQGVPA